MPASPYNRRNNPMAQKTGAMRGSMMREERGERPMRREESDRKVKIPMPPPMPKGKPRG